MTSYSKSEHKMAIASAAGMQRVNISPFKDTAHRKKNIADARYVHHTSLPEFVTLWLV